MEFDSEIWSLFKIKRTNFNSFDSKVEKILNKIYEKGRHDGQKEFKKKVTLKIKNL